MEGPCTCLTFLGIEIDTVAEEVRLPVRKVAELHELLGGWLNRKRCTKRELLSITDKLQHAATVVHSGRTFVRRLFDLSARVKKPDHHIKLNPGARSDLAWWAEFLKVRNGISMMRSLGNLVADKVLTSDASGWGCGAFWEDKWFQLAWYNTRVMEKEIIAIKELILIVLAGAMWGKQWEGSVVKCRCDNEAVVAVLRTRTSRDGSIMHLLRCLFFLEAHFAFSVVSSHVAGVDNGMADDLSRDRLFDFLQASESARLESGCHVPTSLLELVCNRRPDWTSPAWRQLFSGIVNRD